MKKSKLKLKENPTLEDFQKYVQFMVEERGFEGASISQIFMLFLEECGELAKASRKAKNMKVDKSSEVFEVADEVADVFIYLLRICNFFEIDMEDAFRKKEEKNKLRAWR